MIKFSIYLNRHVFAMTMFLFLHENKVGVFLMITHKICFLEEIRNGLSPTIQSSVIVVAIVVFLVNG